MSTPELRRLFRAHHEEFWRVADERKRIEDEHWMAMQDERIHCRVRVAMKMPPLPDYPPYPEECRGMTCGAKTRAGTPCKQRDIFSNGRCKFHGGLSTGPKTAKGKRKALANLLRQSN